jgi:hypothetical protein
VYAVGDVEPEIVPSTVQLDPPLVEFSTTWLTLLYPEFLLTVTTMPPVLFFAADAVGVAGDV